MNSSGIEVLSKEHLEDATHHDKAELKLVLASVRGIIEALGETFAAALDAIANYSDAEAYDWLTDYCKAHKWDLTLTVEQSDQFSYAYIQLDNYRLRDAFVTDMAQQEADYYARVASGERVNKPVWFITSR